MVVLRQSLSLSALLLCCLLAATGLKADPAAMSQQEETAARIVTLVADADAAIAATQYEVAAGKLTMAYNLLELAPEFPLERNVLNSLASLYYSSEQYALASDYYHKLVKMDEASGDDEALAVSLYNLAHVVASLQQFTEAEQFLQRSLELSRTLQDHSGVAYAEKALGVNAQAAGHLPQAQMYLSSALIGFTTLGDTAQHAAVLRNLADVELALFQPEAAINHYQEAIPMLQSTQLTSGLIRAYRGLSQAFEAVSDLPNALSMQHQYADLLQNELQQQSLASTQQLREQLDLRRYVDSNNRLEQQTSAQQAELDNNKRILQLQLIALALTVTLVGVLSYMFMRSSQIAHRMRTLATTDELTGLLNRRAIMDRGNQEWQRADRYQETPSCLVLDVDHFKSINDTWGHAKGDEVLKLITSSLSDMLRQTDYLGRIGGEEFLLITAHTNLQHAQVLAERIRKRVSEIETWDMGGRRLTISIGIATFNKQQSFEHCVQLADKALYHAKRTGRDRWALYHPSLDDAEPAAPIIAPPQLQLA